MRGFTDFIFNKISGSGSSKLYAANGFSNYEEYLTGGGNRFYYNRLNQKSKALYDVIVREIENFPEEIDFPMLMSENEYDEAYRAVELDNPVLMMIYVGDRRYNVVTAALNNVPQKMTLKLHYSITRDTYFKMKNAVLNFAKQFEEKLLNTSDPFEKENIIHDYVTLNTEYDKDESKPFISTPYGVIFEKRGLCEGYSKTMKILLEACGIETILVSGNSSSSIKSGPHMWNQVKVNGRWYNLDATWDSNLHQKAAVHNYFNVTDDKFYKTHILETKVYPCNSLSDNYYVRKNLYFDRFDSSSIEKIKSIIRNYCADGEAEICFCNERVYFSAYDYLINQKNLGKLLMECLPELTRNGVSYKYSKDDENCVLRFSIR